MQLSPIKATDCRSIIFGAKQNVLQCWVQILKSSYVMEAITSQKCLQTFPTSLILFVNIHDMNSCLLSFSSVSKECVLGLFLFKSTQILEVVMKYLLKYKD